MKLTNLFYCLIIGVVLSAFADENPIPQFKNNIMVISHKPFVNKLILTQDQQKNSRAWKEVMQKELAEKVNFSGHYRLYISKSGEFPKDCGYDGWVCGWIIDKETGMIVSNLPVFNGNANYYSTIDNGTPSPNPFFAEFYRNSNMIWINGENIPKSKIMGISYGDKKCSNNAYLFKSDSFLKIFTGECEVDHGDDSDYK